MDRSENIVNTEQATSEHCPSGAVVTPLRKQRLNGELYKRDPKIEAHISELAVLPRDEMIALAGITNRADSKYIPSECLVYFIRASRHDDNELWFERLYRILIERVLRSLPKAETPDGKTESFSRGSIRDYVFNRFVELLSLDRCAYNDKLDYFEIRFDGAVAKLRLDARKRAWRDENRFRPLEYDAESNELSPQVERAAGSLDPFPPSDFDDAAYRSRFDAAIETLPPEQARVIHMLKLGMPIDSKDPAVMTIAKALGRSEKTVRTYRDKAFVALRAAMANGDE